MAAMDEILSRAQADAKTVHDNIANFFGTGAVGCWMADFFAAFVFAAYVILPTLGSVIGWLVANIGATIIGPLVISIGNIRNTQAGPMNELLADVAGEFFGADFDTSNLQIAPGQDFQLQAMQAIGSDIYELLENEFAPDGVISPASGLQGAQAFVGFSTNFAVRTAFVELVAEMIPEWHLEGFRTLGEQVAQNMGLGRLVRRALQPLIQTTITTPLTWNLNQQYRPKRLNETQLAREWLSGALDEGSFTTQLQQLGYQDPDIQAVINDYTQKYSVGDVAILERYNIIDHDTALGRLAEAGYTLDAATAALVAEDCRRADHWLMSQLTAWYKAYTTGAMDITTFDSLLNSTFVGPQELAMMEATAATVKATKRKSLTLSQVTKAFENNVLTLDDLETALLNAGYTAADAFTLVQLAYIAEAKAAQKSTSSSTSSSSGTSTSSSTSTTPATTPATPTTTTPTQTPAPTTSIPAPSPTTATQT